MKLLIGELCIHLHDMFRIWSSPHIVAPLGEAFMSLWKLSRMWRSTRKQLVWRSMCWRRSMKRILITNCEFLTLAVNNLRGLDNEPQNYNHYQTLVINVHLIRLRCNKGTFPDCQISFIAFIFQPLCADVWLVRLPRSHVHLLWATGSEHVWFSKGKQLPAVLNRSSPAHGLSTLSCCEV